MEPAEREALVRDGFYTASQVVAERERAMLLELSSSRRRVLHVVYATQHPSSAIRFAV